MKNKFMQTVVGTFLGLLLLFGCAQTFVIGQHNENQNNEVRNSTDIEGVWQTTVTQRVCGTGAVVRTFQGLLTFDESGTIAETSAVTSPALRSPGHGVWKRINAHSSSGAFFARIFSGAFIFLRFNPDGTFAGTQKVSQIFELSRASNAFEATGSVQVFDPNGNLIATGCATATGTRFE